MTHTRQTYKYARVTYWDPHMRFGGTKKGDLGRLLTVLELSLTPLLDLLEGCTESHQQNNGRQNMMTEHTTSDSSTIEKEGPFEGNRRGHSHLSLLRPRGSKPSAKGATAPASSSRSAMDMLHRGTNTATAREAEISTGKGTNHGPQGAALYTHTSRWTMYTSASMRRKRQACRQGRTAPGSVGTYRATPRVRVKDLGAVGMKAEAPPRAARTDTTAAAVRMVS